MAFYVGVVDRTQDAEGAYGVWFPDLNGCTAMGSTMHQLFGNAIAAMQDWAEVEASHVPPPRTVDEITSDPGVMKAVKEDRALLIQVPLLLDQGRPVRANISLDLGLLKTIDEAAKQRNLTRSAFLVSAALDKIKSGA